MMHTYTLHTHTHTHTRTCRDEAEAGRDQLRSMLSEAQQAVLQESQRARDAQAHAQVAVSEQQRLAVALEIERLIKQVQTWIIMCVCHVRVWLVVDVCASGLVGVQQAKSEQQQQLEETC